MSEYFRPEKTRRFWSLQTHCVVRFPRAKVSILTSPSSTLSPDMLPSAELWVLVVWVQGAGVRGTDLTLISDIWNSDSLSVFARSLLRTDAGRMQSSGRGAKAISFKAFCFWRFVFPGKTRLSSWERVGCRKLCNPNEILYSPPPNHSRTFYICEVRGACSTEPRPYPIKIGAQPSPSQSNRRPTYPCLWPVTFFTTPPETLRVPITKQIWCLPGAEEGFRIPSPPPPLLRVPAGAGCRLAECAAFCCIHELHIVWLRVGRYGTAYPTSSPGRGVCCTEPGFHASVRALNKPVDFYLEASLQLADTSCRWCPRGHEICRQEDRDGHERGGARPVRRGSGLPRVSPWRKI